MTRKLTMVGAVVAASFGACAETETAGGYACMCQVCGDTAENYDITR